MSADANNKHHREEMSEWDRTIQEAIDQAKHELAQENKGSQKEPAAGESKQGIPEPPSAGPSPPRPNKDSDKEVVQEEEQEAGDFITTLGRVMMELPKQLEGFFDHGLSPEIYSEKVRFIEPTHSGMHLSGRSQYMGVARVLRIAMNAYFSDPSFTIVQMKQVSVSGTTAAANGGDGPHDGNKEAAEEADPVQLRQFEIYVRWVFEGTPRHADLIGGHMSRYEGEFRYTVDSKTGLISVHEVTAIHPAPPTGVFASAGLARWAGWLAPRGSLSLSNRH
ncbi:hypothetical protein GQ54DRAFT_262921 [Martensiomyces pterosporus]|nr:hypothetical protein GQ54DRAFT_262921 [Martensiomyces pterosporus]